MTTLAFAAALLCGVVRTGPVSYYGREGCATPACLTSTGEVFRPERMTAAASSRWMIGHLATVRHARTGRQIVVRVNDYCPSCARLGRPLDLSRGAMRALNDGRLPGLAPAVVSFCGSRPAVPTRIDSVVYWHDDSFVEKEVWRWPDGRTTETFTVR